MNSKNDIIFKRKVHALGDSLSITIPLELCNFLNIEKGDTVSVTAYSKEKGKFIAFWKED